MLTVERVAEPKELEEIRAPWSDLSGSNDAPYLSYEWFKASYDCLDNEKNLFVLVVKDRSQVVGIAPFLISCDSHYGIPIKKIQFVNSDYTPFQDFLLSEQRKEETLRAIIDYLDRNRGLWDLVELKEVREASENMRIFDDLCREKGLFRQIAAESRSTRLSTNVSWEQGLCNLKPRTRKEFRRKLARLEGLGKVTLECIDGQTGVDAHLRKFFAFWERVWEDREPLSSCAEFYFRVARGFLQKGGMFLYALLLDDESIAYLYSIKVRGTLFAIKTTYDPCYYAFSPGVVLFYKVLERAFEDHSITGFDFGRGERQYKNEWNVTFDPQVRLNYGHRKNLYGFVRFVALPAVKRNQRANALLQRAREARSTAKSTRDKLRNGSLRIGSGSGLLKAKRVPKGAILVRRKAVPEATPEKDEMRSRTFRFGTPEDVNTLAVAMAARNFENILEKFKDGYTCFLSMEKKRISCYVWLESRNHFEKEGDTIRGGKGDDLVLCDFGPDFSSSPDRGKRELGMLISMLSSSQEYGRLTARVGPQDEGKIRLLEDLGFEIDEAG